MTPSPLEQTAVYVVGLAIGWALIPKPPKGRPMIPKTVAAVKSFAQSLVPARGEALALKVVKSFDRMADQLARAQVQIQAQIDKKHAVLEQERQHILDLEAEVNNYWVEYEKQETKVFNAIQPMYDAKIRAAKVQTNISALVGK